MGIDGSILVSHPVDSNRGPDPIKNSSAEFDSTLEFYQSHQSLDEFLLLSLAKSSIESNTYLRWIQMGPGPRVPNFL